MAVDPNIKKKADDIRNKIYGKEVRESLASGLEEMSSDVVENEGRQSVVEGRQDSVESQWQVVSDEMTDKDVISAPEIIAARNGEANLKARLDKEHDEVTAQLAQTVELLNRELSLGGSLKYGKIELPSDFNHNINFDLWRDIDGSIRHNHDIENELVAEEIYYVSENGRSQNDGLSPENPVNAMSVAVDLIQANDSITTGKIIILGGYLSRALGALVRPITKNIIIEPEKDVETIVGTYERNLTWQLHSGNIYKSAITSSNFAVYDRKFREDFNLPTKYKKVNSISECGAVPGSFYSDGTSIYVHRIDGSSIDNNELHVCINAGFYTIDIVEDVKLIVKDLTILNARVNEPFDIKGLDGVKGNFICKNVNLYSSFNGSNGFKFNNLKSVWMFNCLAKDIDSDAFNYHATENDLSKPSFVFEYNCVAINAGVENLASGTSNATTAHDEMHILRVGSIGQNTRGPVLADVNGCYSINYDCTMNNSLLTGTGYTNSAFCFNDSPWSKNPNPTGKAVLVNCSGGDSETYGINCDESFKEEGKITIDNFKGKNIPNDIQFSVV